MTVVQEICAGRASVKEIARKTKEEPKEVETVIRELSRLKVVDRDGDRVSLTDGKKTMFLLGVLELAKGTF
jgi:hypothetical protein